MSSFDEKAVSEHEELLSDNNFGDFQQPIHKDIDPTLSALSCTDKENKDPLVEAAFIEHEKTKQTPKASADEQFVNDVTNTFRIPSKNRRIKCGISWNFVDENKLIDLDLIVTALDLYSFEMDSVNKDHKKMFKRSITYNKNKKHLADDKLIDFKLENIPTNVHSLWFRINAYSGDSLKDVDSATFNIYAECDDEDSSDEDDGVKSNVLYTYDVGMGFDSGAILLGILYRSPLNNMDWEWTIVEEKNLYAHLIVNNLNLIYDNKVIAMRPNDKSTKCKLSKCNEQYIIDSNISKLSIGIGWELTTSPEDELDDNGVNGAGDKQKLNANAYEIDIDVDASVIVFGNVENEENEHGEEEETCKQIDIVNNNNGFYKTYVQYIKTDNYGPRIDVNKRGNNEQINGNKDKKSDDSDNDELGVGVDCLIEDDELFDVYQSKMNGDNDIGYLCVILNIFNDQNVQNQAKTNNIKNVYVRLIDAENNKKELCRYSLSNINRDKKTNALVLGYMNKLENGCWALHTNNMPLKQNSKLEYREYAKQIVLNQYSTQTNVIKESCCVIL